MRHEQSREQSVGGRDLLMPRRCDEIEQCVYSVVLEYRISLDSGLFCQNIVVFTANRGRGTGY